MLKPIPRENPDKNQNKKKRKKKKNWRAKLRILHQPNSRDDSIIRVAKNRLDKLIKGNSDCPKEIREAINELRRSILVLERKRLHILRKQNSKKKP